MSSFGNNTMSLNVGITSAGTQTIGAISGVINSIRADVWIVNGATAANQQITLGIVSGGTLADTIALCGVGVPASGTFCGNILNIENLTIAAQGTLVAVCTPTGTTGATGHMFFNAAVSSN